VRYGMIIGQFIARVSEGTIQDFGGGCFRGSVFGREMRIREGGCVGHFMMARQHIIRVI